MPTMANVTVKAANGTTDVVFTALAASGGDKVPARWRVEDVSKPQLARPTFSCYTLDNGPKTARRMIIEGRFPTTVTDSTTNVTSVPAQSTVRLDFLQPLNVPATQNSEAAAQMLNFMAAQLIKDSATSGYAPRSS